MAYTTGDVFSPYEIDQFAIRVEGEDSYTRDDCVGTMTVERETKTITKSCRGVVKKRKTRPTGNGTITIRMHVKLDLYRKINAIKDEGLQPGVHAFDNTISMPEFSSTARVKDEDDNVMFKAFPRCKIEEINSLEITNGAEEVAEIELKISYMPDEFNKGEYEAMEEELTGDVLTPENWMTDFSSERAQAGFGTGTDEGTDENADDEEP